jgi:hypothetical protein
VCGVARPDADHSRPAELAGLAELLKAMLTPYPSDEMTYGL